MEPQQPTPLPAQTPHNKVLWFLGMLVCVLAVAFAGAYVYLLPSAPVTTDTPVAHPKPTNTEPQSASTITLKEAQSAPMTGTPLTVTWLPAKQTLPDLHLRTYTDDDGNPADTPAEYFLLGSTNTGADVLAMHEPNLGPWSYNTIYIVLRNHNTAANATSYTLLTRHAPDGESDWLLEKNTPGTPLGEPWQVPITLDTTTYIPDLVPLTYTLASDNRVARLVPQGYIDFISTDSSYTKSDVAGLPGYYAEYYSDNVPFKETYPDMHLERLYKKLPGDLSQEYYVEPDFYQQYGGVPHIAWNNNTQNATSYRIDGAAGCGGHGAVSIDTSTRYATMRTLAGTTSSGEPIYDLSVGHPLLQSYYTLSGGKRFTWDEVKKENIENPFTLEDFAKVHGVLEYTDILGRTIVFSNDDYGPQAECGKPVIYLYPTQTTDVSVRVGADITVSEPAYGAGWSVRAQPQGDLTLVGSRDTTVYPYLFWEGTGHGTYPNITKGIIVPTANVEHTLRTQLSQLGLRGREVADFLEFWLPRMPHTPYVRLSWLGTHEMNELAPLAISPKPESIIRVFLDFVGVDTPYPLEPQTLTSRPRTGFTVVEWGGLLRK